jgi:hypothetical protein
MLSEVRAILAAVAAAVLLLGCAENAEPPAIGPGVYSAMNAAALATVGSPSVQDLPFGEALLTYSRDLSKIHADQHEQADASIRNEVLWLAVILERMPAAATQPVLRSAAARMRAAMEPENPTGEETKRALALAADALLVAARRGYALEPDVAPLAREFAGAVSAIDSARWPPDRAAEIAALARAERALAMMYAMNVR